MKFFAAVATLAVAGAPVLDTACTDSRAGQPEVIASASASALAQSPSADSGSIRELIEGIRGANAIQCEMLITSFNSWTSDVPDRDVNAWRVTQRARHRLTDRAEITWLSEQMRGTDACAARASARLLGHSPAPAARTLLVAALSDPNAQVRRLAAVGVGMRSDSTMNARLITLLRDRDPGVRAAAAWALGAVHDN